MRDDADQGVRPGVIPLYLPEQRLHAPPRMAQTATRLPNSKPYVGSCRGCDAKWRAIGIAHCSRCHRHFGSESAFDLHWVGPGEARRCVDPAGIKDRAGRPRLRVIVKADGDVWAKTKHAGIGDAG